MLILITLKRKLRQKLITRSLHVTKYMVPVSWEIIIGEPWNSMINSPKDTKQ